MKVPFSLIQTADLTDSKEPLRSAPDLYLYLRFQKIYPDISKYYIKFLRHLAVEIYRIIFIEMNDSLCWPGLCNHYALTNRKTHRRLTANRIETAFCRQNHQTCGVARVQAVALQIHGTGAVRRDEFQAVVNLLIPHQLANVQPHAALVTYWR